MRMWEAAGGCWDRVVPPVSEGLFLRQAKSWVPLRRVDVFNGYPTALYFALLGL